MACAHLDLCNPLTECGPSPVPYRVQIPERGRARPVQACHHGIHPLWPEGRGVSTGISEKMGTKSPHPSPLPRLAPCLPCYFQILLPPLTWPSAWGNHLPIPSFSSCFLKQNKNMLSQITGSTSGTFCSVGLLKKYLLISSSFKQWGPLALCHSF